MEDQKVKITRTSEGLRNVLFDTLEAFLSNKIDHIEAKTVAKLSGSLLKSVALDMEYKRAIQSLANTQGGDKAIADLRLNIVMGSNE